MCRPYLVQQCMPAHQGCNAAPSETDSGAWFDTLCPSCQTGGVVSYTQGSSSTINANMDRTLTAAAGLLPDFKFDARRITAHGRLKLVDMFVHHSHPLWWFNNAITLTLWALQPGQAVINLQVIRLVQSPVISCRMPCPAMPDSVVDMCVLAHTCHQLSSCKSM